MTTDICPTTCPDASDSPASLLPHEPATGSAVAGAETSAQVEPSYAGEPCETCGGEGTLGDERTCAICDGTGRFPTWQDLYHRARSLAARIEGGLRAQVRSLEESVRIERQRVENAQHEVRLACDRAQLKICEMEREHRAEVEDLKRQLRRRAVPMTADQIERDDGEVAA